jgi:hypothetical protein
VSACIRGNGAVTQLREALTGAFPGMPGLAAAMHKEDQLPASRAPCWNARSLWGTAPPSWRAMRCTAAATSASAGWGM